MRRLALLAVVVAVLALAGAADPLAQSALGHAGLSDRLTDADRRERWNTTRDR